MGLAWRWIQEATPNSTDNCQGMSLYSAECLPRSPSSPLQSQCMWYVDVGMTLSWQFSYFRNTELRLKRSQAVVAPPADVEFSLEILQGDSGSGLIQ